MINININEISSAPGKRTPTTARQNRKTARQRLAFNAQHPWAFDVYNDIRQDTAGKV